MADDRPRRAGSMSDADRALESRARRRSPVLGVPATSWDDDITGQYQGEDLAQARARRPTVQRLARLEAKQDEDRGNLHELAVGLAGIRGELKVLPELVELIKSKSNNEHQTRRLSMTTRARVIIAVVGALGTGLGVAIAALSGCA